MRKVVEQMRAEGEESFWKARTRRGRRSMIKLRFLIQQGGQLNAYIEDDREPHFQNLVRNY